ncbi:O-acetyltransferase [Natrialba aegyptia DSM 13077]|uniref:O-acetyltransferase n=1 Tax=Natrialba aegyptia DSM 13077 TaxID=1227491 RepID=M0AXN0_9EURY|nr:O-acetyltransferase [Natrialba aegyptia DSM 13077]
MTDNPDVTADNSRSRHDRIRRHPTPGVRNSLAHWTSAKHPLRVALNYLFVWFARISPSLRLRRWCLRRLGVTVEPGVSWGLEATPDVFWPELITMEKHAIVGYDATLLCHEFLQDEYRTGEIVVGERAMIGAGAIVLPGVEIGAGASVAANSLVTRDVEPGTTVAGVPARKMGGGSESRGETQTQSQSWSQGQTECTADQKRTEWGQTGGVDGDHGNGDGSGDAEENEESSNA